MCARTFNVFPTDNDIHFIRKLFTDSEPRYGESNAKAAKIRNLDRKDEFERDYGTGDTDS